MTVFVVNSATKTQATQLIFAGLASGGLQVSYLKARVPATSNQIVHGQLVDVTNEASTAALAATLQGPPFAELPVVSELSLWPMLNM
jgi:hypothetical protein